MVLNYYSIEDPYDKNYEIVFIPNVNTDNISICGRYINKNKIRKVRIKKDDIIKYEYGILKF